MIFLRHNYDDVVNGIAKLAPTRQIHNIYLKKKNKKTYWIHWVANQRKANAAWASPLPEHDDRPV